MVSPSPVLFPPKTKVNIIEVPISIKASHLLEFGNLGSFVALVLHLIGCLSIWNYG